ILALVKNELEGGSPLWKALQGFKLLPAHALELIRIGEESGKLTENLKAIALQTQKEKVFRSKIRSAVMYPAFIFFLAAFIGIGVSWFILPRLSTVFSQLHIALPLITRVVISIGEFFSMYGLYVVPAAIFLLMALMHFLFCFNKTKFIGQEILFHIPGVKRLIREVEVARFGHLLGTLLAAGVPVIQALSSLSQSTGFRKYRRFYQYLAKSIEEGNSFQQSFALYKRKASLIPNPVQQMVVAGEQSGNLSAILSKIGEAYEDKTEATTKNLTVILEPFLLVMVWLGVVGVALAIILPIYSLTGGLSSQGYNSSAPSVSSVTLPKASPLPEPSLAVVEKNILRLNVLSNPLGYVNIRKEPWGEIVKRVSPGEVYEYIATEKDWYQIVFKDGSTGWIHDNYINLVENE
ncbi:MAG: type II secretion system F family protein, partial [Candidatus Wildermuthbacteria bacterium]|nr:type II secretion system F family protein [Candidatus Wildermuthbacteria bacterium]